MKIFIDNCNRTLCISLNLLRWVGYLVPDELTGWKKRVYPFYFSFTFMFVVGIYLITQTGALIKVWGNITEMTETSFLLFTNLALTTKIVNVVLKRRVVLDIIAEGDNELRSESRKEGMAIVQNCNKETSMLLSMYITLASGSVFGWAASAEKGQLPLRAWYPFDVSKFPAYQLAYTYQSIAVVLLASANMCLDQLTTSLTAVCCCRLRLANLSLRTLCQGLTVTDALLSPEEDSIVQKRLQRCVSRLQATLDSAAKIQDCFTVPILAQFTVSVIIICATAYQLAVETNSSSVRLLSMWSYLFGMAMQVFLYCHQAHNLSEESAVIADAAYECPWYACSISLRRSLLFVMVRSRKILQITAGGFATLSLSCFVSIIKASYSFFTVLQQVQE